MKRIIALFLMCLFLTTALYSQERGILTINAGHMNPRDAKSGLIVGAVFSTAIDQSVDIGFGFDIFHKDYSEEAQVAEEEKVGLTTKTYTTTVDYTRTIIPLHLVLNVKIPMSHYFGYFVRGSIGYSFLISKEKNYELQTSQTRQFGGLGWRGSGGLYYQVGRRSTLFGEVFYNSNEVSRSVEKSDIGLPITERVNLSGLGMRLGVGITLR